MTHAPLFSVVIPTFNRASELRTAVASVLGQTLPDLEVIIVDDGSTDATPRVVADMEDPRVRYLRIAHSGVSVARNAGAAMARGRYITFLDSDDQAAPRWLATFAAGFREAGVEVVRCGHIVVDRDGTIVSSTFPAQPKEGRIDVAGFAAGAYAMTRDLLLRVGGFREELAFGENTELAIRLAKGWGSGWPPIRAFPSLLIRRSASGRSYGHAQGEAARSILETHWDYAEHDRRLRRLYHRVAGVHAAKAGDLRLARHHLVRAVLAQPWSASDIARVIVSTVPPLASKVWSPERGASAGGERPVEARTSRPENDPRGRQGVSLMDPRRAPEAISVILPVRNGARTLGAQLAALARQDFDGPWELIVVDNLSTDGSADVAERYRKFFSQLRVVPATRRPSLSHARNAGMRAAAGEFLAFCDADDVVSEGWLSGLASAASKGHLVAGALDSRVLNDSALVGASGRTVTNLPLEPAMGLLPFASGGNFGVWRAVAEWLGGWREDYVSGEDVEFSWRAQLAGFSLVEAPEAVVNIRLRSDLGRFAIQMFRYALTHVLLYRDYAAAGAERRPASLVAKQALWLLARSPTALMKEEERWRWARVSAQLAGHLWGSIRAGVVYL